MGQAAFASEYSPAITPAGLMLSPLGALSGPVPAPGASYVVRSPYVTAESRDSHRSCQNISCDLSRRVMHHAAIKVPWPGLVPAPGTSNVTTAPPRDRRKP